MPTVYVSVVGRFATLQQTASMSCFPMATVKYRSRYFFLRGNLYKAMGRFLVAHFDYAEAIKQSKTRKTAVDPDYFCARGVCFRKMGSLKEALDDLNNAIHLKSDNGVYYFQRGLVHFQGGDYAASERDFGSAIRLDSQTYRSFFNRANCRRKLGNASGAVEDLREASQVDPTAPAAHNALGLALCEQGDYFGALQSISLACTNAPSNSTYLANRGLVHYHLGNLGEALADYNAALQMQEGQQPDSTLLFHRGNALLAAGKGRDALADLTMAAHLTLQGIRSRGAAAASGGAGGHADSRSTLGGRAGRRGAPRGGRSGLFLHSGGPSATSLASTSAGSTGEGNFAGFTVDDLPVLEGGQNRAAAVADKIVFGDGGVHDPVRAGEGQVSAAVTAGLGLSAFAQVSPPPLQPAPVSSPAAAADSHSAPDDAGKPASADDSDARRAAMVQAKFAMKDRNGLTLQVGLPAVQDISVNAGEEASAGTGGATAVSRWGSLGQQGGSVTPRQRSAASHAGSAWDDDVDDLPRVLPTEEDIDLIKRTGEIVVQPSEFRGAASGEESGTGGGGRTLDGAGMSGVTSLALVTCRQQHSLGLAFQSLRKYEAALEHFQLALALWAGHAPSRYHSSLMLHALGDHDQAEGELGILLYREPDSQRVLEARGLARQAMGHHSAAVADFSQALEIEERGETYYHRAVSHLASKPEPNVQAALRDLKSARKTGFKRGEVYDKCATAFLLQGDVPSAIAAYTAALELDPTNLSYLARRSQCHRELGDAAEAEKDLTVALAMPHADASLLYLRGLARYDQDHFDESVEDLEGALHSGVDPSTLPDVYYSIGLAHANSDRHREAEAAFSAALGVQPPPPRSLQLLYVHERAKSRQMIGWHHEAVEDFSTVIALNGGNAHAYFRRAFSQKALGRYETAAEDFETARMLQPTNPHLMVNYSTLHEVETIILCAAGEEPAFDNERFPTASVSEHAPQDGEVFGPPGGSRRHSHALDEEGVATMRDKIVRQAALRAGGRGDTPGGLSQGARFAVGEHK